MLPTTFPKAAQETLREYTTIETKYAHRDGLFNIMNELLDLFSKHGLYHERPTPTRPNTQPYIVGMYNALEDPLANSKGGPPKVQFLLDYQLGMAPTLYYSVLPDTSLIEIPLTFDIEFGWLYSVTDLKSPVPELVDVIDVMVAIVHDETLKASKRPLE